jgi:hypothetical protein
MSMRTQNGSRQRATVGAAVLLLAALAAFAEDQRAVWDAAGDSSPAPWLVSPGSAGAALLPNLVQFGLLPPADPPAIAVTVFFSEAQGSALRAKWTTAKRSVILSNNLFEGIGMENRRSLLIPASLLDAPGTLTFEDPSGHVDLRRVVFEWTSSQRVWIAPGAEDSALITGDLKVLDFDSATGAAFRAPEDRWSRGVLRAALYDQPVRIEPRTAFEFQIDTVPSRLRLEALLAGLPPEAVTRVFINGTYAGVLHVEVPPLADPGYGNGRFVGWRKAAALLPPALLAKGPNRIWFEWDAASPPAFIGVREISLELDYPSQAAQPQSP